MTTLIDIKQFQWVLAFDQPFGPYHRTLPEQVELFISRGGGWESCRATEIFLVHQVQRVMPKTYQAVGGRRFDRYLVIAALPSEDEAKALRDELYSIGAKASDDIEQEMYRLIAPFAEARRDAARKDIHAALPNIFGRDA
jgi:hypothetical protein